MQSEEYKYYKNFCLISSARNSRGTRGEGEGVKGVGGKKSTHIPICPGPGRLTLVFLRHSLFFLVQLSASSTFSTSFSISLPAAAAPRRKYAAAHRGDYFSISCFRSANSERRRIGRTRNSGNYWEAISPTSRASTARCRGGGSARTVSYFYFFSFLYSSLPSLLLFLSFLSYRRGRPCTTRNSLRNFYIRSNPTCTV